MNPKPYRGVAMEGRVAHWYESKAKRERDEFEALARHLAEPLPPNATVLEVAPGPGYLAIELAKLGRYQVTGLDVSETFVRIASANAEREGVKVDFQHGDVADMPFDDEAFDSIACQQAFQNFSRPEQALREMRRVLKPGGTAVLIEMRRDVPSQSINEHVSKVRTGVINWLTNQAVFRLILKRRAYSADQLRRFATASGFHTLQIVQGPMFLEAWLSKPRTY